MHSCYHNNFSLHLGLIWIATIISTSKKLSMLQVFFASQLKKPIYENADQSYCSCLPFFFLFFHLRNRNMKKSKNKKDHLSIHLMWFCMKTVRNAHAISPMTTTKTISDLPVIMCTCKFTYIKPQNARNMMGMERIYGRILYSNSSSLFILSRFFWDFLYISWDFCFSDDIHFSDKFNACYSRSSTSFSTFLIW